MVNERFKRLSLLIGEDETNCLTNKTVLILGLGGVGGYVCESLARCGVGTLILVDFDRVDITNINRQIIALTSTIGKLKVDVFKERIKDINPECNVITYDIFIDENNYKKLFENDIDYFVDCCDNINAKKHVIKHAVMNKIPIISSMGTGNRMDPSKLEIVEIRKTSGDPIARIIRKYFRDERISGKLMVLCSRELPKKVQGVVSSNSFVPSSAGLLISSYIIKELICNK